MHPFALAGLLILPSAALSTAPQSVIHLEDATRAVLAAHPELAGASIELPTSIPTRDPAPALQAGPIERWGAASGSLAHVRLRCDSDTTCRPFYATVHLAPGTPAPALVKAESILRPGTHASMLIDSGRIHLRIPVTCLGSGAPGAQIRVAGPKNARYYQATVVDETTVRGTL